MRELAFLNAGVTITLDDEREAGKSHRFHYDGGIVSFVEHLNKNKGVVNEKPVFMHGNRDGIDAEIALQWNDGYNPVEYLVREQHQHARRRHAPLRASGRR